MTVFLWSDAIKRASHLRQNLDSLDCEPTIKVLWAYCIVVTCCLWGGDVILLACVETISQSELAIVPLWPMRGAWLCHIVVTSVTLLTQSTICSRSLMDSAASKFYTNGHQGPGLTTVQWPGQADCDAAGQYSQLGNKTLVRICKFFFYFNIQVCIKK